MTPAQGFLEKLFKILDETIKGLMNLRDEIKDVIDKSKKT